MKLADFILFLPEIFFLNALVALLWVSIYLKTTNSNYPNNIWLFPTTYGAIVILLYTSMLFYNTSCADFTILNSTYQSDSLINFQKILTLLLTAIILLVTLDSNKALRLNAVIENVIFKAFITFSLILVASSLDLVVLFFALEIYALSSYVLVGQKGGTSIFSSEASLKYLILGTSFSLVFIYGGALLYSTTGLTNLSDLAAITVSATSFDNSLLLGLFFVLSGLMFKLSIAPYHFWSPDVYEGSSTTTMFYLSIVPKIILLFITFKIVSIIEVGGTLSTYLFLSGIISVLIGSVGGLFQKRIKRLLAYSMITNTGYLSLLLGLGGIFASSSLLFFLIVYLLTMIGVFVALLSLRQASEGLMVKNLYGLANNFYINTPRALAISLLLFSSAGIPPFAGFLSKYLMLIPNFYSSTLISFLVIIILFVTSLSVFYYIRITKVMSFYKKRIGIFFLPVGGYSAFVIALSVILTLVLFIITGTIFNLSFILSQS